MLFAVLACTIGNHPVQPWTAPAATDPAPLIDQPGPLTHVWFTSVRTTAKWSGLANLDNPATSSITEEEHDIVLPVHVLRHPTFGDILIDSGIALDEEGGADGPTWLVRKSATVEIVEPLAEGLAARGLDPKMVLITHMHLDHLLGLRDISVETPVFVGPGEQSYTKAGNGLLRRTYRRILEGRGPLQELDFSAAIPLGPMPKALDLLGDGSLWALWVPGHTPGSVAFLARTVEGPVLFTGDACHTVWGWQNRVEPGTFSLDIPGSVPSLLALETLVEQHPQTQVWVGHEVPAVPR